MQISRGNNSRTLRINNAKFSGNCFYMNTNLYWDFQICISVPLTKQQNSLYHALSWSDSRLSSWWRFSLEVPLVVPVIAREALYWNDCNFWWKAELYTLSCIRWWSRWGFTYKQFRGSRQIFEDLRNRRTVLLTCLQDRRNWRDK